jgi:PAS domain S-box-containing protein
LHLVFPDGREEEKVFHQFPVTFGRGYDSAVVFDDANVSRHHAEIYLSDEHLFIRDCKSLNGVRVNGETVLDTAVVPGDSITISKFAIEVLEFFANGPDNGISSSDLRAIEEGDEGILEVIRTIDLHDVIERAATFTGGGSLEVFQGEESPENYEKLSRAYTNLLTVMNFVARVGGYSHPQQICEQFVAALRKVFTNVENIFIVENSHGMKDPEIVYREGLNQDITGSNHPSRTVLGRVIQEMRAVYAVDARRDPRFQISDSVKARGVRSMMCAPLVARGEMLGAIYVENLSQPYCFNQYDLNLLTVFAFHLAGAMEISRLLEERDKAFEKAASSLQAAKKDKIALLLQYSQSEKKFRALFEQSALGAAVINMVSNRIEEVNDGLVRMVGYSRRQLTSMYYKELLAEETAAGEWLAQVRKHGEVSSKTILRTNAHQRIITLQSCRALRVGDSQVMVAYFIDITAKERAEEETRRQLQRVTALSELSQALMANLDPEATFRLLLEKVQTVLPVDQFQVAIRDSDEGGLSVVFFASPGSFQAKGGFKRQLRGENDFVRRVVRNREAILHSAMEPATSAAKMVADALAFPEPLLMPSALFIPLASRKQVQGLVVVQCERPRAYDHTHLETLQAMVAQASLALTNARAFEEIREQEESLRQLSLQIMTAQETERARISRELHDGIGQQLTAMKYILEAVRNSAKSGGSEKLLSSVNEARELATQIIQDLRNISLDIRPTMLDDLGLGPTLDWFVRQYEKRCGTRVELRCELDTVVLNPEFSTAVYRIIQEALGNVAKHAEATLAKVEVLVDGGQLVMKVEDNGVGFSQDTLHQKQTTQGCSGLLNMKERAHFLGGEFRLETAPGEGTKLRLAIPIKET